MRSGLAHLGTLFKPDQGEDVLLWRDIQYNLEDSSRRSPIEYVPRVLCVDPWLSLLQDCSTQRR